MPAETDGPVFICWAGGKPPRAKRTRCSVCKTRWSTLLCDGLRPAQGEIVFVKGTPYQQVPQLTCDAPLCAECTTRPESPPIALPDYRGVRPLDDMTILQTERRLGLLRLKGKPRRAALLNELPPDTRDFCPACVARMDGNPTKLE